MKQNSHFTPEGPRYAGTARLVAAANRWRDAYNPLRGLTLSRVVTLCEAYDRGEMASVQWAFRAVERRDPDLLALVERRMAALMEMDWHIRVADGADPGLAAEQSAALRQAYESVDNLRAAIEHLGMALFRGFAHVQKQPHHWELVDSWNVVRNGIHGAWKYNPAAADLAYDALPDPAVMDPAAFITVEHARPVDFYALPKFARCSLAEKDWTAFVEIYGVPGGVVILPPDLPPGREEEYAERARSISEGASGALPHGSDYRPNDSPRGGNPFREYLDYFTGKLILAGTGGMLTMLTQSGSGTLAGNAHSEAFRALARGHARRISEALQRQFDVPLLEVLFPGRPCVAGFELGFQTETATAELVEHAAQLARAGYRIRPEVITERTGYPIDVIA